MRWFELAVMAALYAKERCNDNIDVAYQELIKALDRTGFLGSRILYLHPEVSPPYFWEQIRTKKSFPPPNLPHKTSPLITRNFIDARIKELSWEVTKNAYLARCWIQATYAARWFQSKGMAVPAAIRSHLDNRNSNRAKAGDRSRRWKQEYAAKIIRKIWPGGGVQWRALANKDLVSRVQDHLKENGDPKISRETILRAAGRA
jgi:hypothetical protein